MSNNFYTPTGAPAYASRGLSASIRAEFVSIEAGFQEVQDVTSAAITGTAMSGVDTGTANQYAVTVGTVDAASYIAAYTDGVTIRFRTSNPNTGASVINVNTLGNKSILRRDGSALQSGDILASSWNTVTYNSAAGAFYLLMGVQGTAGTNGTSGLEPYEERANTAVSIGNGDASKKIKVTGTGNSTQAFDAVATLTAGWRTRLWNATTGYLQVTSDGATYRMYPGEEREFYVDKVNNIIRSAVLRGFRLKDQSAGSILVPPSGCGYKFLMVRATGSGAGGGGGGGGGSGRSGASPTGGAGGSGGAAGQSGATVVRRIPLDLLPTAGTSISYSPGAAGAKGAKGTGGAGVTAGSGNGNIGSIGTSGSAGNQTTFGASTDNWYVSAPGGAAGVNRGNPGAAGTSGTASGGAAITNSVGTTAAAIQTVGGAIQTATANGSASVVGGSTSTTAGAAGGASGDSSQGIALQVVRSGASLAPGGAANSNPVPSVGNNGTTPSAETSPGVGGLGGGGGGGSPGHTSNATGNGGDGGDGANGGPGEIEIWAE
jgi:hypothetical protein